MFPSDGEASVAVVPTDIDVVLTAKRAFKFTPKDIETLKREEIQASSKSFVSFADAENLARRKYIALNGSDEGYRALTRWEVDTHTRSTDDPRCVQTNWGIYRNRYRY